MESIVISIKTDIAKIIKNSISVKEKILQDAVLIEKIQVAIDITTLALNNGGQILFCGNGGSASDAQHLAAELSGRFYLDRDPLNAEALHVNTSYLTAVANDYSYDEVYSRILKAKGNKNGVLYALSTSGNSKNIVKAIKVANELGMKTIGLSGNKGGDMADYCDVNLIVPSDDTPRIQEAHIMIGHIICEFIEKKIFG